MAVARTSSAKTWPHSEKALLLVRMTAAAFVAAADQLEHHVRRGPVQRQVADLVEDEDGGS